MKALVFLMPILAIGSSTIFGVSVDAPPQTVTRQVGQQIGVIFAVDMSPTEMAEVRAVEYTVAYNRNIVRPSSGEAAATTAGEIGSVSFTESVNGSIGRTTIKFVTEGKQPGPALGTLRMDCVGRTKTGTVDGIQQFGPVPLPVDQVVFEYVDGTRTEIVGDQVWNQDRLEIVRPHPKARLRLAPITQE